MSLSCDIQDIGYGVDAGCEEFLAGLASWLYVVNPEDLVVAPQYNENGKAEFQTWCFNQANFKQGKQAYRIKIKKQTGHNQATGTEGPRGYSQQLEFTIDKDVKNAAQVLRVIKNKEDFYFLVPETDGRSFQVVGDPVYGSSLNSNYNSGTTPDSDSGHMVTVTSNPSRFSLVTWTPGTDNKEGESMPAGITGELKGFIADTENGKGTASIAS